MAAAGATTTPDGTPQHIGRYRVVEPIGKGAMGRVFAAVDEAIGRRVAIKVMMGDLQDETEVRERFYREAKIMGQLSHPNVVTVFDFGESGGHPFIVMELLTGLPLAGHLATPAAAGIDAKIGLMMQACEGLQAAHNHGVIHRDIKPSNLFVQRDGTLKILDFGVARLVQSHLTRAGFLLGTPEYMSPEQAQGRPVDARSDLFSAAAVFYWMLAGQGPFASPELPKILRAVISDDPPPLTDAQAPEPLRRVLKKALAKSPAERYQQCVDLLAELEQVRRGLDGATRRIEQAALDWYKQILGVIEERRVLGRSFGVAGTDASCDEAVARLAARFPVLAAHMMPGALLEPIDRAAAAAALESLKRRHNTEVAGLAALRSEAAEALRRQEGRGRTAGGAESPDQGASMRDRAAALWRRVTKD
jgi:serine/threonine-protein kinase